MKDQPVYPHYSIVAPCDPIEAFWFFFFFSLEFGTGIRAPRGERELHCVAAEKAVPLESVNSIRYIVTEKLKRSLSP